MYFTDFLVAIRRRWYLALVGLLLTAGLATAAVFAVPVTYTSTTSILMLPPQSGVGVRGNPYLNLAGLGQALEVLSSRINASDGAQQVALTHPDAEFTVGPDPTSAAPVLLVVVTADSAEESMQVRDELAGLAPQSLVAMQDVVGVREGLRITSSELAADREPTREIKNQLRAVIAIVAVGIAGTLIGTGYIDYFRQHSAGGAKRRRRRRGDDHLSDPTAEVAASAATSPTGSPGVTAQNPAGDNPDNRSRAGDGGDGGDEGDEGDEAYQSNQSDDRGNLRFLDELAAAHRGR